MDALTGGEVEEGCDSVGGEALGDVGGGEEALPVGSGGENCEDLASKRGRIAVSYTHLTLPTIYSV